MRKFVLFLSGAGKFYLGHVLRELTRDVTNDVRVHKSRSDVTLQYHVKLRMAFEEGRYVT